MAEERDRRGFLKLATCALGGGLGLVVVAPAARLFGDPAGKTTVTSPSEPIDVGPLEQFRVGSAPTKVSVVAPRVTDAWAASQHVVLGAAWVRRPDPKVIEVFSGICPHLGCGIGWNGTQYMCPCHESKFAATGERESGKARRGLDALDSKVLDGHLWITWATFVMDTSAKTPA
ncbi:MAG: Rieske 2Fe-2S domain-containing protein [Deltaproteobacteria bacterium]|nr:Rieske 2Fe-2S domain-containing protein [Deltaproteobacteria bacterium]